MKHQDSLKDLLKKSIEHEEEQRRGRPAGTRIDFSEKNQLFLPLKDPGPAVEWPDDIDYDEMPTLDDWILDRDDP